ncbi:hypothetical protein NQ318_001252 [Aromia moschata]|uniref:Uncharacterized protein n=1 Tax=Aromia moschata TaxID=1265417 RepID=A0AAV8ZHB2_9CUCU|nr:hypothetical protein NQ318_001252 [Aromia moschata]
MTSGKWCLRLQEIAQSQACRPLSVMRFTSKLASFTLSDPLNPNFGGSKSESDCTRQPALYVLGLWWGDLATRSNKCQLATDRCSGRITRSLRVVTVTRCKKKCNVRLSNGWRSSCGNHSNVEEGLRRRLSFGQQIFRWHKAFAEGREDVNDENRAGRPSTSSSDDNVKRVRDLLNTDRRLSVTKLCR